MNLFIELVIDFIFSLFLVEAKQEQHKQKRAQRKKKKAQRKQEKTQRKQEKAQRKQEEARRKQEKAQRKKAAGKPQPPHAKVTAAGLPGSVTEAGLPGHDSYFLPEGAALPEFSYQPSHNGDADPGEVVWAWVPFEDDPSVGKDRPVLVLAKYDGGFICAQMTSKNHEDFKETRWGRRWMDIGTGDWDRQRRNSEVRLDRFVFVPAGSVRREGGRVSEKVYSQVVDAIVGGR
ncbi:type II toxin-antitoxin system PemK/MazF family toxin [Gleimia sp. 6138-11-ORH1]|uniref:type II toxin-antitoxin system PemK/MazF family toxin n=1 Tax=Gleimia sp. 6138-11-ORH1 TaxID=2973937 RepID=UPI002166EA06|nr:type II toxin-antitoxin system PemK/MazF family toxin [Gleimia sp. 6138-11-ORH1]MCS4485268.1 type II toxin-antitoxin system PemK/MazF family toxin [Gleimia sp. 6138-11-ORH1]